MSSQRRFAFCIVAFLFAATTFELCLHVLCFPYFSYISEVHSVIAAYATPILFLWDYRLAALVATFVGIFLYVESVAEYHYARAAMQAYEKEPYVICAVYTAHILCLTLTVYLGALFTCEWAIGTK